MATGGHTMITGSHTQWLLTVTHNDYRRSHASHTITDGEGREENTDVEEREKERERGSNLWRQRLASPSAQVLVAQTTQPVQKNWLRDELQSYVRTYTVDWTVSVRTNQNEPAQDKEAQAASSACFFPFFLPPPNPQSTVSVRT